MREGVWGGGNARGTGCTAKLATHAAATFPPSVLVWRRGWRRRRRASAKACVVSRLFAAQTRPSRRGRGKRRHTRVTGRVSHVRPFESFLGQQPTAACTATQGHGVGRK